MPPDGYPAFLQYLQSVRVRKYQALTPSFTRRGGDAGRLVKLWPWGAVASRRLPPPPNSRARPSVAASRNSKAVITAPVTLRRIIPGFAGPGVDVARSRESWVAPNVDNGLMVDLEIRVLRLVTYE